MNYLELYQLYNTGGEEMGLVKTVTQNISKEGVQEEWSKFCFDDFDADVDKFCEHINEKYPGSDFERVYIEEIRVEI